MAGWLGGWAAGWLGGWVAGRLEPPPPPPPPPTDRNPPIGSGNQCEHHVHAVWDYTTAWEANLYTWKPQEWKIWAEETNGAQHKHLWKYYIAFAVQWQEKGP